MYKKKQRIKIQFSFTFLLSLMFNKIANIKQAKVLARRNIITYFHFSLELKGNYIHKLKLQLQQLLFSSRKKLLKSKLMNFGCYKEMNMPIQKTSNKALPNIEH